VLPQLVGYALRERVTIDRIAFWQSRTSPPESWTRDVSLLVSAVAPDREFRLAARWTLGQAGAVQPFALPVAISGRYVRLCIQSRQGTADFVSLGGFVLGVQTGDVLADMRPLGPLPAASR
jgi:hypothetical protein